MAESEGAVGRQFQSLSIVLVCAVNTKFGSLFELEFSLQVYMELTVSHAVSLHFVGIFFVRETRIDKFVI
jgi:hypothetical protein